MKNILLTICCIFSLICNAQNWSSVGTGAGDGAGPMAVYNGELYVGGWFTQAGGISVNSIAKWNGSIWSTVGTGITGGTYPLINTMAVYNGELYVGGSFTTAGGSPALNIAKWNGSAWSAVASGLNLGTNSGIFTMEVFNNQLIIGGYFDSINGLPANGIAVFNGTNWSALGGGINRYGSVNSLYPYDSILYVAGNFDSAGGIVCNSIAQWNGSQWSSFGSGIYYLGSPGYVYTTTLYDKQLFVGGTFDSASSFYDTNTSIWNGSSWNPIGPVGKQDYVYPLCSITANGKLYVGGTMYFVNIGGVYARNILSWDGKQWDSVGSGLGMNGDTGVEHLCIYNNALYATGEFTNPNSTQYYISKFDNITGITPIEQLQTVNISPNPSNGIFNFTTSYKESATIIVYNMLGEEVLTASLNFGTSVTSISLPNGEGQGGAGIYLYRVLAKDGSVIGSGKLIKE